LKILKIFKKFFKKLNLLDHILIISFLIIATAFFIFLFRKSTFLTVTVKVTEKNILYAHSDAPDWFSYLFKKGMNAKDGIGRKTAEIEDVYFYDSLKNGSSLNTVYLTLKLKTVFNKRTGEYKYKGTSIVVGEGLKINLEKILIEGLIVGVDGLDDSHEELYFKVKAQLKEGNLIFSETTGVDPFVANALQIGDKVLDSRGEIIAEILDKEVYPAKRNTFDDKGNIYQKFDPLLKDVFLTLKVKVKKIANEYYFLDDISLKINSTLPLHFNNISIWPTIIEISSIN
jgi:hypothetical protein